MCGLHVCVRNATGSCNFVQNKLVQDVVTGQNEVERVRASSALSQRHLKRNFISTVRITVHSDESRKRSFSETLLKPKAFENAGFDFFFVG